MKIVPVLDILDGAAVHAVRGIRKEYKLLKSAICTSSRPLDVASTFENLGFTELYIADLDAISGKNQHFSAIRQIAKASSLKLMVDAGVSDLMGANELLRSGASKVIVGTETLSRTRFVGEAIRSFGKERILVSLDLKNGILFGNFEHKPPLEPMGLLRVFCDMGLDQVIVLDLARVGGGEGVNVSFVKQLLGSFDLKVFVGGGARSVEDLMELKQLGVSGVLLATALHSGALPVRDLLKADLEL